MRDYYRILGVAPNAHADEIRQAFRRLARRHHPDLSGDSDASSFVDVQQAYHTLSDEQRRRSYDQLAARRRPTPTSAGRSDWFADEVAIDFPSVGAAIDRIREAFLGEESRPPLRAEIRLSAREAFAGVTVPLEVPVRGTCARCGGRGEIWTERCWGCGGTGERFFPHHVRLLLPRGVANGSRFRFRLSSPYVAATRVEVRVAVR